MNRKTTIATISLLAFLFSGILPLTVYAQSATSAYTHKSRGGPLRRLHGKMKRRRMHRRMKMRQRRQNARMKHNAPG